MKDRDELNKGLAPPNPRYRGALTPINLLFTAVQISGQHYTNIDNLILTPPANIAITAVSRCLCWY